MAKIIFKPHMLDGKTPRCQLPHTTFVGGYPHWHQCVSAATVGEYCKRHDPAAIYRYSQRRKQHAGKL